MADRLVLGALLAAALSACGGSETKPELVVGDATIDGAPPVVIGATASTVGWTASAGAGTTHIAAASLASLPAQGQQLATASGLVAPAGDHVLYVANQTISRVSLDEAALRLTTADPEALAASSDPVPVMAWTLGPVVSWGVDDLQTTATLAKIDRCDHARVTSQYIYVAADGATGRRLLRIDQRTGDVTPITSSTTWAPMFPGGAVDGATYVGRIVDANDDGALWLVEEMPSRRGILVHEPVQGDATVILEHVSGATGFFGSADALYWQEGDALLTAPRAGGPASIIASLPGAAGALAGGYVYFAHGAAIERLRVE
jgi:hypothetical protein